MLPLCRSIAHAQAVLPLPLAVYRVRQGACKSAGNFWRPESCKLDLCASCVQVVVLYVDEATSVNRQLARQARSAEHNKKVQDALVGSLMCANFCSFALRKWWKEPMTCTDQQLLT